MNKLTAEKCREIIEECRALKERGYLSINGDYKLQALEIALPILEQQERVGLVSVAFTGSGSLEAIKRGDEGFIWGSKADAHPIELFVHSKDVICVKCNGTGEMDSGGTQPWGEQILIECDCQLEQQRDSEWIKWDGSAQCPVSNETEVVVRTSLGSQERRASACIHNWKYVTYYLVIK